MWVTFVDLENDTLKCQLDMTGPQDSKYCADGGVYYTYNFIERGDHKGTVGYPWGAQKLSLLDLNLTVGCQIDLLCDD